MADIAIRAENLSKQFRIGMIKYRHHTLGDPPTDSFKSIFRRESRSRRGGEMIWALKDVSFEVKHREVIGIIGRNGAVRVSN